MYENRCFGRVVLSMILICIMTTSLQHSFFIYSYFPSVSVLSFEFIITSWPFPLSSKPPFKTSIMSSVFKSHNFPLDFHQPHPFIFIQPPPSLLSTHNAIGCSAPKHPNLLKTQRMMNGNLLLLPLPTGSCRRVTHCVFFWTIIKIETLYIRNHRHRRRRKTIKRSV